LPIEPLEIRWQLHCAITHLLNLVHCNPIVAVSAIEWSETDVDVAKAVLGLDQIIIPSGSRTLEREPHSDVGYVLSSAALYRV